MLENKRWGFVAPKLLIGLSILLWGIMTEQLVCALLMALVAEAYLVVKIRWSFSEKSFIKAWYSAIFIIGFITFLYWVDGAKRSEYREVLLWLPLAFFPLYFVQKYAQVNVIPLNTFSVIARKTAQKDLDQGREVELQVFNTTVPYFIIVILASGLADRKSDFYGIIHIDVMIFHIVWVILLLGYLLVYYVKKKQGSTWKCLFSYVLVLALGAVFLPQLLLIEDKIKRLRNPQFQKNDIEQSLTKIGSLQSIKNSKQVQWRMWVPEKKPVPRLIPIGVFNYYTRGLWAVQLEKKSGNGQFFRHEAASPVDAISGEVRWTFSGSDNKVHVVNTKNEDAYKFLATMNYNASEYAIPHLPNYFSIGGIVGKEANVERSGVGGVQIGNPDATIQNYLWIDKKFTDSVIEPISSIDTLVPDNEKRAVGMIAKKLNLARLSDHEKIKKLRKYFQSRFEYTTHLTITEDLTITPLIESKTALAKFLLFDRKGHCEYFATASALILRAAGVPTRYVNGFVVDKEDRIGEAYALRGHRAHAWCQAWVNGRWINVDLTPSSWEQIEAAKPLTLAHQLIDWWKMLKEDFQVWKNKEENKGTASKIIWGIVILIVLWLALRLYFFKKKEQGVGYAVSQLPKWRFLKKFNRWCVKKLGDKEVSETYAQWVSRLRELEEFNRETQLDKFIELYMHVRFGKEYPSAEELGELERLAREIRLG